MVFPAQRHSRRQKHRRTTLLCWWHSENVDVIIFLRSSSIFCLGELLVAAAYSVAVRPGKLANEASVSCVGEFFFRQKVLYFVQVILESGRCRYKSFVERINH
eukprot:GHVP01010631.1.p1 GENE.GHVP01010631.1~~GHVP01010631.1.p1  ORF type:complete len:103 (-),score=10.50 GHVP01010631.1:244-552(-)